MPDIRAYSTFSLAVVPSPDTNDFAVTIHADGIDLIATTWPEMIGMDPDDILGPSSPLLPGQAANVLTVARCSCGVVECAHVKVAVDRSTNTVEWSYPLPPEAPSRVLRFPAQVYDSEVRRALSDFSWETPARTTARLLAPLVDRPTLGAHGLRYQWASSPRSPAIFTISLGFEPGPYQVLLHLPVAGEQPQALAYRAARQLVADPRTWPRVEWIAQGEDRGPPPVSGPGWSRFAI